MEFHNQSIQVVVEDGIAWLTLKMIGRANAVNETFIVAMNEALDWTTESKVRGIVLQSGHSDFCVGADLNWLVEERSAQNILAACDAFHALHKRLETGPPVVAALEGSALGGGFELALACHHRVALSHSKIQLGLPEVMLGVLPGGGGTQRLPRMVGAKAALEYLTQGKLFRAPKALKKGLVDELVQDRAQLEVACVDWINKNPRAKQPWHRSSFVAPPPIPGSPDSRNLYVAACAMAYKKTAGAFPAVQEIISCVAEGLVLDFDNALLNESRHFAKLAVSDQAKDMIQTLFFRKQRADKQLDMPKPEHPDFQQVAIIGAGMMGAGLAFVCAKAGYKVILKDITEQAARAGGDQVRALVSRLRHLSAEAQEELLALVKPTTELSDLRGCDLVIEAVFENEALKHRVTKEIEPLLATEAVWASNTSALPISNLAKASLHPERFIGLHFFSPVEKMPLLEIILGEKTDEETLARCLVFGRRIKKTCAVVNDGYGFFTSRVFSSYILEGAQLVAEGHKPALVEWGARCLGMVVPPLQVFDEVTLSLGVHAISEGERYLNTSLTHLPGVQLVKQMVAQGRKGKSEGAGFYEYKNNRRAGLWPGLSELCGDEQSEDLQLIKERLLMVQLAEVGRLLDSGVLRSFDDAEVMAIFGIGFAPGLGGPLSAMDRIGMQEVVRTLDRLSHSAGVRFTPSKALRERAEAKRRFFEL